MSTINVKSSKSAASAVNYVLYGADPKVRSRLRSEGRTRAAVLAIHTADGASTPEQFLARAESLARLHGRKVEAYTYVLAFHPDEFDVTSPEDMQRVCDVAKKLTESMHSADYLIAVHTDSKGQHAHAHITVTNHDNLTGKALSRYTSWRHGLHQLNDQIMREEQLRVLPDPTRPKPGWLQRREDFSPGGFEQQLGDIVNDALADPRSVDQASFEEVLAEHDVRLAVTDRDGWSFKMRRLDNGKWGRKKASALSPDFTADKAQDVFAAHRQVVAVVEDEEEEEIAPKKKPPLPHPQPTPPPSPRQAPSLFDVLAGKAEMPMPAGGSADLKKTLTNLPRTRPETTKKRDARPMRGVIVPEVTQHEDDGPEFG